MKNSLRKFISAIVSIIVALAFAVGLRFLLLMPDHFGWTAGDIFMTILGILVAIFVLFIVVTIMAVIIRAMLRFWKGFLNELKKNH